MYRYTCEASKNDKDCEFQPERTLAQKALEESGSKMVID